MAAEYAPEYEGGHELEEKEAAVYVLADHQATPPEKSSLTPSEAMLAWVRRNEEMGYGLFLVEGGPRPAGEGWHFADSFPGPEV